MKLTYNDLSKGSSLTYSTFGRFDEDTEKLFKELNRRKELSRMFTCKLQEHKELPMEAFDCAMSWLDHSNKTPSEIISIIFENNA